MTATGLPLAERGALDDIYAESRIHLTVEQARMLRPEVVLAHVRSDL